MSPANLPDIIPGLSMIGYGYDVFASPYCLASERKGRGGKPLLDGLSLSAKDPYEEVVALQRPFRYPKILQVSNEQPTDDDYTIFGRTVEEYNKELTVTAKVGVEVGAFSGNVQTSYSQSTKTYLENVYGEHGHIYSGIDVRLGALDSASALRSLLNPQVNIDLQKRTPKDVIARFGTHLVTGVMIGGKALLRQVSSRSDVKDETEFQLAVQAKYGAVTAEATVDQKYSAQISKFKMSNTVHTLGGKAQVIESSKQFNAWLQSLNRNPAIIEMTSVVPLWQLLDPGKARDALKDGILSYARRYQAGALYGSLQRLNNNSSSEPWKNGPTTGHQIGRYYPIAQASSWSEEWSQGNSELSLYLSTGMEKTKLPALAVYGGRQMHSSYDSSAARKEIHSWGSRTTGTGSQLQELTLFSVYTNSQFYKNGMSFVSLFVGPVEEARDNSWIVVGGHEIYSKNRRGFDWGQSNAGNLLEQKIASARMYKDDGWDIGDIILHLQEATPALSEIPE
jgi:hypothetical protein